MSVSAYKGIKRLFDDDEEDEEDEEGEDSNTR